MTLIVTCLAPGFTAQVSESRLTHADGSVADPHVNKILVGHTEEANFTLAYTGTSRIGSTPTDAWLLREVERMELPGIGYLEIMDRLHARLQELASTNPVLRRSCLEPTRNDNGSMTITSPSQAGRATAIAEQYIEARHQHDADAVVALHTRDTEFTSDATGLELHGREQLRAGLAGLFLA